LIPAPQAANRTQASHSFHRKITSRVTVPALAQTDEIQVYDAEIEGQGKIGLEIHKSFTPSGRKTPGIFRADLFSNRAYISAAHRSKWHSFAMNF
jgi:hypothetical protein